MIPYGRQNISATDIESVIEVLRSDFITQGPAIERFEKKVSEFTGAKYAVAVNNATAALHIACLAAGLKHDDILYTSPITFVASANCALYCGASVAFCDINEETYNLDPTVLEQQLSIAEKSGTLPKVLVPVHLAGQSCDMESISKLARKYHIRLIEDASHAIGGSYKGRKIGSCEFSDMTVFSFHPVKIVTTGEGGMITTNDPILYAKLTLLRSHGITRDASRMTRNDGPWYYEQQDLGYNYRLTDIQAALGASQLSRIDTFIEKRNALASRYNELLKNLPVICPYVYDQCHSAFHLYIVRIILEKTQRTHVEIFTALRNAGIGVNLHYIPIYRQPYYARFAYDLRDYPVSESYYQTAISLPLFYDLKESEQYFIVEKLKSIL